MKKFNFVAGVACFALTAFLSAVALLLFLFWIYSINNNHNNYVQSKFAYLIFKAYWVNMVVFFKLFAIYFVNFKMIVQLDVNMLFLIISAFYILLFIL